MIQGWFIDTYVVLSYAHQSQIHAWDYNIRNRYKYIQGFTICAPEIDI